MALTAVSSGTYTSNVGGGSITVVQQSPASPTTYVFRIDTSAMAAGDTAQLLIYTQVLSGGATVIEENVWIDGGANPTPSWLSTPIPVDTTVYFNMNHTAGTSRNFPWKLFSL